MNILEVNLISAQDLLSPKTAKKPLETYVVAYIDPKHKATSRIDKNGGNNPTWDDKFLFLIDSSKIQSWLVLEVYAVRKLKDKKIGQVNVKLENCASKDGKAECLSFYIKGKGGELQGVINIGVEIMQENNNIAQSLFHAGLRSYAYDFKKLMGSSSLEKRSIWTH